MTTDSKKANTKQLQEGVYCTTFHSLAQQWSCWQAAVLSKKGIIPGQERRGRLGVVGGGVGGRRGGSGKLSVIRSMTARFMSGLRRDYLKLPPHVHPNPFLIRGREKELLFVGCLTSQQHASVSQGRFCEDNFTCCHTEIEAADQTFYLTQSQYTDNGLTSPSADPIKPGTWQGSHKSANF